MLLRQFIENVQAGPGSHFVARQRQQAVGGFGQQTGNRFGERVM